MSKQTQNSSFKTKDKSQLGADGDAVIIGPTFMQNYSNDCDRFVCNSKLAYFGIQGTQYA